MFDDLLQDVRYAVRALCSSPGFSAVTVLSLTLGIGANTAIFSLINAVILKTLPVSHPEQLVELGMKTEDGLSFTNPVWEQVRERQDVFSGAFAYSSPGSISPWAAKFATQTPVGSVEISSARSE